MPTMCQVLSQASYLPPPETRRNGLVEFALWCFYYYCVCTLFFCCCFVFLCVFLNVFFLFLCFFYLVFALWKQKDLNWNLSCVLFSYVTSGRQLHLLGLSILRDK